MIIAKQVKATFQLAFVGLITGSSVSIRNCFIYIILYQVTRLTSNGQNVFATISLPQNLKPFGISIFSNSVSFSPSNASSNMYSC
ncbi:MAG: hypothetical protein WCK82_10285 [Bacteroidota bacterium]